MTELSPFRVLSLDGGGMRGTYTATYLDRVAAVFAGQRGAESLDIGAAFDLIVGTSTGGIIGCALVAGVPLGKVVELYRNHGAAIFQRRVPTLGSLPVDLYARRGALKNGEAALRKALGDVLGGTTIREIYERRGIALAVTAVEMSQHRAWVFKTPHFSGTSNRDDGYSLVDVCLATTAAPIFRSMAAVDHPNGGGYNVFIDGGLWSNNPVLVGLIESLDMVEPGQAVEIFSLGTCPMPAGEQVARADVHRGLPGWKFGGAAAALSIDAQQFAFDHMAKKIAKHLDRSCTITRFPSDKVPASLIPYLDLDDTRPEAIDALVNQARADADMTNSRCGYRAADLEAARICALFESAPVRTEPLHRRDAPVFAGTTRINKPQKDDADV